MLRVLRALSLVFAGGILAVIGSAATPTRAAAQVCQEVVTGNGILPPTDNCHTPPVIRATPSNGTYNGKSLHVLVQYCHAYVNLDASTYSISLNAIDISLTFPIRQPDTLPTSGFCGAPPKTGQTAESELFLTLKPGTNSLSTGICTDYGYCADSVFTYTYAPLFPVAVTPDDSATRVYASQAGSQVFVIKRLDSDTALGTYNLTKSCTGAAFSGGCTISPSSVNLRGGGSANATVSYTTVAGSTTGRIVVTAVLSTNSAMTDSGSKNLTSSAPGVTIAPKNVAGNAAPSAPNTAFYTVTNTGPVSATFNFSTGCTGSETSCSPVPTSQAIAGGAAFTATIRYTAGALTTTGVVKLLGVHSTIPSVKDSGYYNITSATPGAIVVTDQSAGSTVERSLCLTVAAGHGAASECGDLRLAHAMPGVRTKNKARTPTLLYNSAHAHPYPTFPYNLTLPSGAPVPDSVTATLSFGGTNRASGKWTGVDFYAAGTRRIVLAFDAATDSTNVYATSLQVKSWYGTSPYSSTLVNGEYALVNRAYSNFGAGWWMAGLEQLKILGDGSLLWMDGDGSTRHYAVVTANALWAAPKVDRPDTVKFSGSYYTRYAEHGLKVIFDNTGKHVYTVNRISDTTMFTYTGSRLSTILVAPMSAAKRFTFSYNGDSVPRLTSVAAPGLPSTARNTTITESGGRITSIREPDSTLVSFGCTANDTNRITSRTDRRGTVGTFTFNAQEKLVKDSIGMDTGDSTIVTQFRPYETVGTSPSSVDTLQAYGLIDGPRRDVGDTTLFWLDIYGAPRKIRNALGADTKLTRSDPNYPALISRVQSPNGRVVLAKYDARGNVDTTTDSASCNGGGCATTTYLWDPKWDFLKKVTAPLGEVTWMSYDGTNGNRLWQQPDADTTNTARRVTFTYDPITKLLATVQEPVIHQPQRVWYDAMGNPDSTQSPTGIKAYSFADSIGRDTLSGGLVDSAAATWNWSRVTYNLADEDIYAKSWSPGSGDSIVVTKTFDAEANLLNHSTQFWPDSNAISTIQEVFSYDRANRKRTDMRRGPGYGTDSMYYDGAGNVVSWKPWGSNGVSSQYDALNRAVRKILASTSVSIANYTFGSAIPADTQTFAYDVAGNMIQANNLYAQIMRAWNVNGTLAADTERVRASVAQDPTYPHIYGTRYGYDLEGRRLSMKYPATIAPTGDDSVGYTYDATMGILKSVRDLYGNRFAFGYDNALRLVTDTSLVGSGNQAVTTRTYDDESRIVAQIMLRGTTALDSHTVVYDRRSKIVSASYTAAGISGVPAMHYARLGPLTNSSDGGIAFFNDSVSADPLGNTHTSLHFASVTLITNMTYAVGTTMLTKSVTLHGLGNLTPDTTTTTYDQAGSASVTTVLKYARDSSMLYHIYSRAVTTRAYGSDLKMMASVTHFDTLDMWTRGIKGPTTYEELEEYRYDALGRRVWRRLTRPNLFCPGMDKASGCLSVVERTIWDGAQVLGEVRADGGQATPPASMECDICTNPSRPKLEGRVLYVHGGALDHPLDVVSVDAYNDIIVPVYNWRGRAVDGICVNGTAFCETDFTWPARSENAQFDSPPVTDPVYGGPVAWAGNIIDTQQDGSGLIYKRNRYYDPASGRFTQIDPIGLGGGLNAYGFGGGDQVSYTDPFGLKVDISQLSSEQQDAIKKLRGASGTFNAWYMAIDKQPYTLTVRNPKNASETFAIGQLWGGGLTKEGGQEMILSKKGDKRNPKDKAEFEAIVAHEFAHAAAGLDEGTPADCAPGKKAAESCASTAQNEVHREIGFRDRNGYSDVGPFSNP